MAPRATTVKAMPPLLLVALIAVLAFPAAASAEQVTFGSSLAGTPDVVHDKNLADTLFFNTSAKNSHKAPVSGEILAIRVKGRIISRGGDVDAGNNIWHSQVLRQNAAGTYTVDSSSQHLYFPVGGNVDDVHTFVPSTQCVKQGEYVDFNHIGGWNGDPRQPGTRYEIFKRDADSVLQWYERDNGTNIGETFATNQQRSTSGEPMNSNGFTPGQPLQEELMMQVVIGTGFDASNLCEGGLKGYEFGGIDVKDQTFTVYEDGVAGARLGCTSGRGFCEGAVRLKLDGADLGSATFKINRNATSNLDVPLSPEGARIVTARGRVTADVAVDSRDEVGQQRISAGKTTLKAARPAPSGFAGTTVRPQTVSVKNGVFSIRATCPFGTLGGCNVRAAVSTQKRVPLRRGSRGKVYRMATGKFTIQPGKTVRVPIKLSSGGKKVMKKVKKVVTIATVTSTETGGNRTQKRVKLTLKRR